MSAGTIALTNNAKSVTGAGTAFATELKDNDFIVATVGGVTYTMGVDSVTSDTALTLLKLYDGPTVTGAAWVALPAAAMSLISAQTAADVARFIRAANYDKINWQQVFSEAGDITVTLIDGSQFHGPSWKKIADLLATLDLDSITEIADQIHADAAQVATDKPIIVQAKDDAVAANAAAQQAKTDAQAANGTAQQSQAGATTQAGIAKTEADRAKAEADRAAASNPDNALLKANSLSDVPDKAAGRTNLGVYSKAEVDQAISQASPSDVLKKSNNLSDLADKSAARGNLQLKSAALSDIVGVVAQTGGVATGAVMESGSNSNGSFIRFADGTQICWFTSSTVTSISVASGTFRRSGSTVMTYPAAFTSNPDVTALTLSVPAAEVSFGTVAVVGLTTATLIALSGATSSCYLGFTAIGRWF